MRSCVRRTFPRCVCAVGLLLPLLWAVSATACTQDDGGGPGADSPELVLVDSVVLEQSDSVFVGIATDVLALGDGTFVVADPQSYSVQRYAADGRLLRRIGRRGGGPGEFPLPPGRMASDGDSVLYVLAGPQVQAIDLATGAFRWNSPVPPALANGLAVWQGNVLVKRIDAERRTSIGVLTESSDSVVPAGPFPHPLGTHPVIDQSHLSAIAIAPRHGIDSVAFTLLATDYVYIGPLDGSSYDSIAIPVVRRRGSRPDVIARLVADPENAGTDSYVPSVPWLLASLPDGRLAALHMDAELVGRRFQGRLHLSIIDPARRRACADAEVPAPLDPVPLATLRGDTLFVLVQEIADAASVRTLIHKYAIRLDRCQWRDG
jgi:hypothetical protein